MNICLFYDSANLNDKLIKGLKIFTDYFIKKKYKLIILTEKVEDKKNLAKINLDSSIKLYSIEENIDNLVSYDEHVINEYNDKYKNTKLLQERLSILTSPRSKFFKHENNFENLLVSHLKFLENLLVTNKINYIFTGILNSYQSYINSILENIAFKNDIKFLLYQYPILRSRVYDNQLRVSEEVNSNYEKNLQNGLTEDQRKKTLEFLREHEDSLNSNEYYDYVYQKESLKKKIKSFKKLKKYIKTKTENRLKTLLMPNIKKINFIRKEDIKTNYSILILNKHNNYRLLKFSPFFSNPSHLVRSISLSLPMNHQLLIKLHPHDTTINITNPDLVNEVSLHHNVKFLDPKINFTKIIKKSSIVFASSSTSAIIEALIFYKHVITFGNDLHHIGKYKAPIQRIINLEDLKNTIDYCLNNDIDKEKILFFMNAFLKGSYRRDYDEDNITSKFSYAGGEIMYLKAAERLDKYISNTKNKIYNN